ncbi:2S proteasome subunit alpha 2 [Nematocida displodere]|uniref:2S proteasome subunit alpha 2 n=1 Tax=Nematocida displodere TaxID=1805483 RepID=A0A177EDE5_9MICR|nr:2S proteasome subunit alpha 2 [Nematocida displodere]
MSQNIDAGGRYTDTGNLLQIEYARKAAGKGNTALGIRFAGGVLLAVEKQTTSKIVDIAACQSISALSETYALLYSGMAHDNNVIVHLLRQHAQEMLTDSDRELNESEITQMLRHYLMYFSAHMNTRAIGCEFLLSSGANGKLALLHADPSGAINQCRAYAIGSNAQAAKTELEKIDFASFSLDDAIRCATRVFHLSRDTMAEGPFVLEMMYVSRDEGYAQKSVDPGLIHQYASEYSDVSMHSE